MPEARGHLLGGEVHQVEGVGEGAVPASIRACPGSKAPSSIGPFMPAPSPFSRTASRTGCAVTCPAIPAWTNFKTIRRRASSKRTCGFCPMIWCSSLRDRLGRGPDRPLCHRPLGVRRPRPPRRFLGAALCHPRQFFPAPAAGLAGKAAVPASHFQPADHLLRGERSMHNMPCRRAASPRHRQLHHLAAGFAARRELASAFPLRPGTFSHSQLTSTAVQVSPLPSWT